MKRHGRRLLCVPTDERLGIVRHTHRRTTHTQKRSSRNEVLLHREPTQTIWPELNIPNVNEDMIDSTNKTHSCPMTTTDWLLFVDSSFRKTIDPFRLIQIEIHRTCLLLALALNDRYQSLHVTSSSVCLLYILQPLIRQQMAIEPSDVATD